MRDVNFTQFLRPDGRKKTTAISMPDNVADKADAIVAAGYRFECELLTTGHVSFTISDNDGDYAIKVIPNGPGVAATVTALVMGFDLSVDPRVPPEGYDDAEEDPSY